MRKMLALCICAMLLLCSCSNTSDSGQFGTSDYLSDYDVPLGFNQGLLRFCRSDDIYYSIIPADTGSRIMFSDPKSGISGCLCSRPECLHNNADCGAYVLSSHGSGLQVYDGYLYFVATDPNDALKKCIYREALDGTARTEIKTLPAQSYEFNSDMYTQFHRGYCYFAGVKNMVDGATQSYNVSIAAEELSKSKESLQIFNKDYAAEFLSFRMQIIGTKIYYEVSTAKRKQANAFEYENCKIELYCYDIISRKSETIYNGEVPIAAKEIWIEPEKCMYFTAIDGSDAIYSLDFASGETSLLFEVSDSDQAALPFLGDNLAITIADGKIIVKDFSGSILLEKDVTKTESNFSDGAFGVGRMYAASDDEYIYYSYNTLKSFAAYPLDGSEPVILWQSEKTEMPAVPEIVKPAKGK